MRETDRGKCILIQDGLVRMTALPHCTCVNAATLTPRAIDENKNESNTQIDTRSLAVQEQLNQPPCIPI